MPVTRALPADGLTGYRSDACGSICTDTIRHFQGLSHAGTNDGHAGGRLEAVMKSRHIARYILAPLFLFWGTSPLQASSTGNAPVTGMIVTEGKVFFDLGTTRTTLPACATPTPNRWVFKAATTDGQAMLATLLTLRGLGKQVSVQGTGTCPDWADTETVQKLQEAP